MISKRVKIHVKYIIADGERLAEMPARHDG